MTATYRFGPTKFLPRPPSPNLLVRERLLAQLLGERGARLVLVHAPAGFGKSTLLSQCRQRLVQRDEGVAWITIDEDDNDVERLGAAIVEALERGGVPGGADLLACIDRAVERWGTLTLFLDEAEQLADDNCLKLPGMLLDHSSEALRIVVGSRTLHHAMASHIRLRGDGLELSAPQLAFDQEEMARFVDSRGGERLPARLNADLAKLTEGWPAALQMAMTALARGEPRNPVLPGFAESGALVFQYLGDEVLRSVPEELRQFLLDTSFLTELSTPLCNAVTGRGGSERLLAEILRRNLLLLPLDESRTRYRFHPLFAEYLQHQLLLQAPKRTAELGLRATRWCAAEGRFDEAVDYALLAGDIELALRGLPERINDLIARHQFSTIRRWLASVPDSILWERPDLLICSAWLALHNENFGEVRRVVTRLEEMATHGDRVLPAQRFAQQVFKIYLHLQNHRFDEALTEFELARTFVSGNDPLVRIRLLNLHTVLAQAQGDFTLAEACSREVIALSSDRAPIWTGMAYAASLSGMTRLTLGDLDSAQVVLGLPEREFSALQSGEASGADTQQTLTLICAPQAYLLYERNELDAAEALLERHRPFLGKVFFPFALVLWYQLRARISLAKGDRRGHAQTLDELEAYALRHGIDWMRQAVRWEHVAGRLAAGELERAGALVEVLLEGVDLTHPAEWLVFGDNLFDAVVGAARYRIHAGDAGKALPVLEPHIAQARAQGRQLRLAKLLVLKAMAGFATDAAATAQEALSYALGIGLRCGLVRIFIDEGPRCHAMLRVLDLDALGPGGDSLRAYRETLLSAAGGMAASTASHLSERETDILRWIAEGCSNATVGRKLSLSDNTVKWYLSQIYAKLSVKNRTQAVHAARQQGLIPN